METTFLNDKIGDFQIHSNEEQTYHQAQTFYLIIHTWRL